MAQMRPLQIFAQGKGVLPMFSEGEGFTSLEFPQLKTEYQTANSAATPFPGDTALRIKMNYAFALLRDSQYSYAESNFMRGLALNADFRSLYDVAKSASDAGLKSKKA